MTEKETSSESANDIREIKDMIIQLRKDVGYLYGLMETMIEGGGTTRSEGLKNMLRMNTDLMKTLFTDKNFEGKERVMEIFDNIGKMGGCNE